MTWMSVKDQLPTPNRYVIVLSKRTNIPTVFYVRWDFLKYSNFTDYFNYWMLIPEYPMEKNQRKEGYMSEITMCNNENCPKKNECYRYLAIPDEYQMYANFQYNGQCEQFWQLEYKKSFNNKTLIGDLDEH